MSKSAMEEEIIRYMETVSRSEVQMKKSQSFDQASLESQWGRLRRSMEKGITVMCQVVR